MFDKLIASDEHGAEFKGRSRYFMVSTFVVGILFISAVVFSLYAADIGLGSEDFELSMMLAPVTPEAPAPPKPVERQQQPSSSSLPTRNSNMLSLNETPISATPISVTPNAGKARPLGDFRIGTGAETNVIGDPGNTGTGPAGSGVTVGSSSAGNSEPVESTDKTVEPPPPAPVKVAVRKTMVSEGVINGKAKSLPVPPYPAPAKLVHASGAVNVQVVIDESGKVVSAKAISGHALLRSAAEKAAWSAQFDPTFLSRVPVKVSGVIVYNFKQ